MQSARDELLACARLAGDEYRNVRLRKPPDGAKHFLHRRRLAEHLLCFTDDRRGRGRRRDLGAGAADQRDRMVDIERLGQILECPALKCRHSAVEIRVCGHDDHRDLRKALSNVVEQRQAGFTGHADVGNQDLRLALLQCLQHLVCRGKRLVRDPLARQRLFEHPTDRPVVVDDPDGLHEVTSGGLMIVIHAHAVSAPSLYAPGRLNSSGSRIVNTVHPGALSHSIVPLCCATNVCAIVRPSPLPPSRPDTSG